MGTIQLKCEVCGKSFSKIVGEYNRRKRLGKKMYCSLSCSSKISCGHLEKYREQNSKNLIPFAGNKRDEYTGFRYYLRKAKQRNQEYDCDLEYLKNLWESQSGKCVYTGVALTHHSTHNDPIRTASLDRIDSAKGYIKGNIQFVSITANLAKQLMTHEQMIEFCDIITNKK